ncbi:VapE domain-containing protein [Xylanibacter oryzae]|uniref:VapE domain-containing protein n=1 Tax=Xylanibacter oryzae TaxID=185293 RepID=UPI0004B934D8|nr:VapE domain-containing protein [Xylanibacter oryzae]
MIKITLLNVREHSRKSRFIDIDKFVDMVKDAKFAQQVGELRANYPYLPIKAVCDDKFQSLDVFTSKIPRVCFASLYEISDETQTFVGYNGLQLLEINNLMNYDDARQISALASRMPQTLLSFMGADGRSVKIVCRSQLVDSPMPSTEDDARDFHARAYRKAHSVYSSQLNISVDNFEPILNRFTLISVDTEIHYNPFAVPFYIDPDDDVPPIKKYVPIRKDEVDTEKLMPGYDLNETRRYVFQWCLREAYDKARLEPEETYVEKTLNLLAHYCHESELPLEMCICHTGLTCRLGKDLDYVRIVFENEYHNKINKAVPLKHIPESALLTYKTEAMLKSRYELRQNIITGEIQYRRWDGYNFEFQPLTTKVKNTMTVAALKSGLKTWDKDLNRLLDSTLLPEYDPIKSYLDNLPRWDGIDRIDQLAGRVPTDTPDWMEHFHVWFLSMVAQWRGKNSQHGNAIVPLLIGYQGSGKSSFCGIILPSELLDYYNDKLSFDNDNAVQLALSRFALINLDEFDSLKKSQQPLLKYLVQKNDVKVRKLYSQSIVNHPRYASFIGTTNNSMPLTDETGSRRFICVNVNGPIDFTTPVDHVQLYAQAMYEIKEGVRYWFNEEENKSIQRNNAKFNQPSSISLMFNSMFAMPKIGEGRFVYLSDIADELRRKYNDIKSDGGIQMKLGRYLTQNGFQSMRKHCGMAYRVDVLD